MEGDTRTSQGLTLQELADRTGVEPRTIRSYVEKGVIPGPETLGRGARYPRETLSRLKVLQLLRDANRALTLDQIRVLLQRLGPSQLAAIASGSVRIGAVIDTDAAGVTPHPKTAAMDYLRALKQAPLETPSPPMGFLDSWNVGDSPADDELSVLENAARALAALAGGSSSARSTRGEQWYRISLTPDIELSVRGDFDTEQLAQLHRIGDSLRTLLTKGPCT